MCKHDCDFYILHPLSFLFSIREIFNGFFCGDVCVYVVVLVINNLVICPPYLDFSLHFANVSVGTPPLSFLVALDTGSDLFWLPCNCTKCVRGVESNGEVCHLIYCFKYFFFF